MGAEPSGMVLAQAVSRAFSDPDACTHNHRTAYNFRHNNGRYAHAIIDSTAEYLLPP